MTEIDLSNIKKQIIVRLTERKTLLNQDCISIFFPEPPTKEIVQNLQKCDKEVSGTKESISRFNDNTETHYTIAISPCFDSREIANKILDYLKSSGLVVSAETCEDSTTLGNLVERF